MKEQRIAGIQNGDGLVGTSDDLLDIKKQSESF